jgi:succinyl-CoA synthetase alpha subunit
MAILIDQNTRVLVQGITGKSGVLQTETMLQYGTHVVSGVTPGKGGQAVAGVPVFDTVREAVEKTQPNAAICFVPPLYARDSALEAIDAGIPLLVLTTEHIPAHDILSILTYAKIRGVRVVGPGTAGIISPGKCKLGAHPARMFTPGRVGILSRSGALSYEVGKTLTDAHIGQSTVVGLGGGPVWGTTTRDVVQLFNEDPETEIIVILGEIGGGMEQQAAAYLSGKAHKPSIALLVGRTAPKGKSFGHAGAIIDKGGSCAEKIAALQAAGVHIAYSPSDIVRLIDTLRT